MSDKFYDFDKDDMFADVNSNKPKKKPAKKEFEVNIPPPSSGLKSTMPKKAANVPKQTKEKMPVWKKVVYPMGIFLSCLIVFLGSFILTFSFFPDLTSMDKSIVKDVEKIDEYVEVSDDGKKVEVVQMYPDKPNNPPVSTPPTPTPASTDNSDDADENDETEATASPSAEPSENPDDNGNEADNPNGDASNPGETATSTASPTKKPAGKPSSKPSLSPNDNPSSSTPTPPSSEPTQAPPEASATPEVSVTPEQPAAASSEGSENNMPNINQ